MNWRDYGNCAEAPDPEAWFDVYEDNPNVRSAVDAICMSCPVQKLCFSYGVSHKEWGNWGGVYLVDGKPDKEYNNHRSTDDWTVLWEALTMD